MQIGEVVARSGVPATTLRYYERIGLIPAPQRVNGRRAYDAAILDTLRRIGTAKAAGFRLDEIRLLLNSAAPNFSAQMRQIAEGRLVEVERTIAAYQRQQAALREALACACESATDCQLLAS